jgi:hypothetical protein
MEGVGAMHIVACCHPVTVYYIADAVTGTRVSYLFDTWEEAEQARAKDWNKVEVKIVRKFE